MRLIRILSVAIAASTLAAVASGGSAWAQGYPLRPIRLIVPFAAGGPADIIGRTAGNLITAALGQPVLIDNRPGGGGNPGHDAIAKAAPDGYTVGIGTISGLGIAPSLYAKLPFDPVTDFTPVAMLASTTGMIVASAAFPANNLAEMIAYARANPEKLSYATPGVGTVAHMAAEMLSGEAGVRMIHVPYRGAQVALGDLLSGSVPVSFESSLATTAPSIRAGRLKALAITRGSRTPLMPDVPTVAESGYPGFDISAWFGLVGPAGLSADVTAKLADAISKGLRSKEIIERLAVIGAEPQLMTPEQFSAYVRAELARWAKVVKASGAKPE